ncbi:MAG: nucleotide exchange factor GrpE [Campylobacteraceae bacterium]|nr:nucleotide exchange factor GrpE [Campylobacteraceae bacterium]
MRSKEICLSEEIKNEEAIENSEEVAVEAESDLETKYKELEDKYIRAYADFENTKKRLEKEKQMAIDYTNEKFAKEMLPIIDSLELALAHSGEESEASKLREGVSLTLDNLIKTFERNGIKQIPVDGVFDPEMHEAIMQSASDDVEDGHIVATLQKGYMFKERVIRPALVNVCKKQ